MAYNLQSLITILDQLLNPKQTSWILGKHKPKIQSLLNKLVFMQQILEKSSLTKLQTLETQFRDVAHKAEDIIESHMVDRMLSARKGVSFALLAPDVEQVTQELDSLTEQVVKIVEEKGTSSGGSWTGDSVSSSKSVVVGIDADLMQLRDRLTGTESKLEIVPIVGMGGIGKTTLARKLYQDPSIVSHFEYARAWASISQDYNMQAILISLLGSIIGKEIEQHKGKGADELKDILYRSLFGRRYLIVLDDIWSTKFWDEMRRYFPDNKNQSRIVITTRESDVAKSVDSKSQLHQVQLLSKSESWNLLEQIVFGGEGCPSALRAVGAKIASDCDGLPLAVNVIGGLLSKVERSEDVWDNIGKDIGAAIAGSDEQFSGILSLSYNHLPNHLKPCFLYMGAFPKDYPIEVSKLMRLWVAEGFLKSNGDDKSLEEVGEDWLNALVERNLLSVSGHKRNGKPMGHNMHDLLRDLCMRKGKEDKFMHFSRNETCTFSNPRRVSIKTSRGREYIEASAESMSLARTFIGMGYIYGFHALFELKLLRVLDIIDLDIDDEFLTGVLQLVNLRYLAARFREGLPRGISRLWNLQTLIIQPYKDDVPCEIWEMPELRYLSLNKYASLNYKYVRKIVQRKLQGISGVELTDSMIETGFVKSFPNIRELGIYDNIRTSIVLDLSHLHKLEKLRCESCTKDVFPFLQRVKFPASIRQLTLDCCLILSTALKTLCALPNLQVLKISKCRFEDGEWEVEEGDEFQSLQYLSLDGLTDLVRWRADETNFPRLRHLKLTANRDLKEIPSGIGEIVTLQLIELSWCNDSLEASAKQIQEVQSDYGNYDLELRIK